MDILDLQLFASEKTERPTPRRREKARRRGQVARSQELSSTAVLVVVLVGLLLLLPEMHRTLSAYLMRLLADLRVELTVERVIVLGRQAAGVTLGTVGPVLALSALAAVAANIAQVGFLITPEALAPKLDRLDPVAGLRRIFSRRALFELLKAAGKIIVVGAVMYFSVRGELIELRSLTGAPLGVSINEVGRLVWAVVYRAALALILIALADYWYQRIEYESRLRMTKQEVKDELKEVEGDPRLRSRLRERQREFARRRMMAEVPTADVVIVNPTHVAVALRYQEGEMPAPRVVAKGRGPLARRIREVAESHGVTVVRRPALAAALYEAVRVGEVISEEFYRAVAEVLAFVYRIQGKVS